MPLRKDKTQAGFTLIEISIVIMIIGLLLAGLAQIFSLYVKEKRQIQMKESSEAIRSALIDFITDDPADSTDPFGRFPCPADPSLRPGDANYGLERRNGSGQCITSAALVRVGGNGGDVFIGAIPAGTLGIAASHMIDPFNNQFTYAVSESVVADDSMETFKSGVPGHINIVNDGIAQADPVRFTLVSHGEDGAGSFTASGVANGAACSGVTIDGENCDRNDGTFAFESALSLGANTEFFDDTAMFNLNQPVTDDEWWTSSDGGATIVNRNTSTVRTAEDLTVGRHLTVTNDFTSTNLIVTTDASIGNNLTVTNNISTTGGNISSAGTLSATGAISTNSTITASGNITTPGDISTRDLNASRNANISGNSNISGNLTARNITANSNMHARGNISADGRILINASCPSGQYLSALSNGSPVCRNIGTDSLANKGCANGQYLQRFNGSGNPVCLNIPTRASLLANVGCPTNQYLSGFNGSGNPICAVVPEATDGNDGNACPSGFHMCATGFTDFGNATRMSCVSSHIRCDHFYDAFQESQAGE